MKGMDLLVFAGQSNMQGQTEKLSENAAVRGALEYLYLEDRLVPLVNPVGGNITYEMTKGEDIVENPTAEAIDEWLGRHALGASAWRHTNIVPAFCRAYIKETGRSVIAVHAAKGSTQIADWQEGSELFSALVQKVRKAIDKVTPAQLGRVYLVWLQGESDALFQTPKEAYIRQLTAFKDALKQSLPLDRFTIIRVGDFTRDERDGVIQAAQEEACKGDKDFYMLTRIASEYIRLGKYENSAYRGHFNALGIEHLGKEAGKELGKLTRKIIGK